MRNVFNYFFVGSYGRLFGWFGDVRNLHEGRHHKKFLENIIRRRKAKEKGVVVETSPGYKELQEPAVVDTKGNRSPSGGFKHVMISLAACQSTCSYERLKNYRKRGWDYGDAAPHSYSYYIAFFIRL